MITIEKVKDFWNTYPCGLPAEYNLEDKKAIFLETERERYSKQDKILSFADFKSFKGKKVLEIGCGIGTDGIQFARAKAEYTGVDLTEAGVNITKERFKAFGESGEILQVNAEKLPFEDDYFDHVYSFGVIHHSENPEEIVAEIYRVLKPAGTITVMLYNRTSFYYLIEVCILRKVFFHFCDREKFLKVVFAVFGKGLAQRFEAFRAKLARMKSINPAPNALEWISMNTDDVFCPMARVYSKKEAKKLFNDFKDFQSDVWFIDKDNWFLWLAFGRFLPKPMQNWLESNSGWFRMIKARK